MAEVWTTSVVEEDDFGAWNNGWSVGTSQMQLSNGTRRVWFRFPDAPFTANASILSATLEFRAVGSNYAYRVNIHLANAPDFPRPSEATPPPDDLQTPDYVSSNPAYSSDTYSSDIADLLQDIVELPGWAPGNAIGVILQRATSNNTVFNNPTRSGAYYDLTVEWEPNVQYLDPVTVQVPVTVGRITPSYAITVPDTIDVPVSVGAVDIVAPRTLNARTVYVPLRVNQAQMSGTGQGPTITMAHTLDLTVTTGIALISVTIPPEPEPEPWERLIQTEEYHEALVAGTLDTDLFVEVIDDSETVLARLGGPDPDYPGLRIGSVTCDGEAAIRWTTEVTVDDPELVPVDPFDLLSPFSYNRLRLWWRIWLPRSQRWGQIPVGTLYPDLPELSDSEEGGLNVTIMASDAVALIKQAVWDVALDLSNMRVHEAIAAILEDRAPWAKWALTPTHYWVPKNFTPGEPNSDPWADIEALADAAGQRAFVDRMGVIRTEPITRPGQPVGTFSEGPGSPMVDLPSVRTDMSRIANKITVTTADPEVDPPPYGYWQDDDPSSPLWIGRGRLYPKIIRNPIVTTNEQAQNYAINEGARRAVTRTVEATILPHPHLNPYDIIELKRDRAALSGTHTLVSWTLDFSSRLMSITATNRKEFQEWMTT